MATSTPPTGFSFEALQAFNDPTGGDFSVLSNLGQPNRTWSGLENVALEVTPSSTGTGGGGGGGGGGGTPSGGFLGGGGGGTPDTGGGGTPTIPSGPDGSGNFLINPPPDTTGTGDGTGGGTPATPQGSPSGSALSPADAASVNSILAGMGQAPLSTAEAATFGTAGTIFSGTGSPGALFTGGRGAGPTPLSSAQITQMNQQLATMGEAPLTTAEINAITGGGGATGGPGTGTGTGTSSPGAGTTAPADTGQAQGPAAGTTSPTAGVQGTPEVGLAPNNPPTDMEIALAALQDLSTAVAPAGPAVAAANQSIADAQAQSQAVADATTVAEGLQSESPAVSAVAGTQGIDPGTLADAVDAAQAAQDAADDAAADAGDDGGGGVGGDTAD